MLCTLQRLTRSFRCLSSSPVLDQPSELKFGVRFRRLRSTGYGLGTVRQLEDVTLLRLGLTDELDS